MKCDTDHDYHETKLVDTVVGKFKVYDFDAYKDVDDCPANDLVSKQIIENEGWSRETSNVVYKLLQKSKARRKLFIDYGAHIGWYTVMAALLEYDVVAIEKNIDHTILLSENVELSSADEYVHVAQMTIDKNTKKATLGKPYREIYMVKIDLDGDEKCAIKMLRELIANKKIRYIVLNKGRGYKKLVKDIEAKGYLIHSDLTQDVVLVKRIGTKRT